jgi:uncharacterized membrane protein YccC
MATAMTVCIGALCTALMDMPSPLRHKFNEMSASVLLCSAVTLLISLCAQRHLLLLTMLVIVSFLACMMVVYGKKSMPLQLATLFIMTMSMEHDMSVRESFIHTGLFTLGAVAYLAYAMGISWVLRHRIKQQVLAEALFELAAYIDIKADFYDTRYNLTEQFNKLVRHQSLLADRQQASRDLILRAHQNSKDAIVVQVHVCMLDLYELILSTHTDYAQLRLHLADSPVLKTLHDMAYKAARDIESVAYDVTRKKASYAEISYEPELAAIEAELAALQQPRREGKPQQEALAVLRAQRNKIRAIIKMIGELHPGQPEGLRHHAVLGRRRHGTVPVAAKIRVPHDPVAPAHGFADLPLLAAGGDGDIGRSGGGRVAAVRGAQLLDRAHHRHHPQAQLQHDQAATARPHRRHHHRLRADGAGHQVPQLPAVILGILILSTVAMPTFVYLRYRYAAVAVSMMILLQMHLLAPGHGNLIMERLIDTAIGAVVATAFSFVLANWEYQTLPNLIREVLEVNLRYMQASFDLLQGKGKDDFAYRIERKRLMDSLASLSSALVRMLDEPARMQRAVEDINLFIVQNYLLVAHVAALRAILRRHVKELPTGPVNAMLAESHDQVVRTLAHALAPRSASALAAATSVDKRGADVMADAMTATPSDTAAVPWSGWPLVQRRIRLLQADAVKIIVHSEAIVRDAA